MKAIAAAAVLALLAGVAFVLLVGAGLTATASTTCTPGDPLEVAGIPEGEVAGYSGQQLEHAATIMAVGAQKGLDAWGQAIGVMTAMGESSLLNVDHGDKAGPDSRGLFQQRANGAWGTYEERMDPATAAGRFFDALLQQEGWRELEPTIAAHRVQRNADPLHYADYWNDAVEVVTTLAGENSRVGERYELGPVKPHTQALAEEVGARFDVAEVGGHRATAVDSGGHPAGLALDFMTYDDPAKGDAIVAYLIDHAERLSVDYVIWRQAIWRAAAPEDGWQPMADRGSPTANHYDHPHVNVRPLPNPNAGPTTCLQATTSISAAAGAGEWVAPVDAPVSSEYGWRNLFGKRAFHGGTDLAAACGTPIYAAAAGRVIYAGPGPHPRYGLTGHVIVLDHGGGLETTYNHMYADGVHVRPGQTVTAGQVIAEVGSDGNSTGCHLHYGTYQHGQHTDPQTFMAGVGAGLG